MSDMESIIKLENAWLKLRDEYEDKLAETYPIKRKMEDIEKELNKLRGK